LIRFEDAAQDFGDEQTRRPSSGYTAQFKEGTHLKIDARWRLRFEP
jgi:hypothetical protein